MSDPKTRCGFIAVVGRPNVGKSTLVNALVGDKVSIVAPKPQTTRHRINGIRSEAAVQMVFVDTPGLHQRERHTLNAVMNRAASAAVADVDMVLFVVESGRWSDDDEAVLERLKRREVPVGLVLSKVDQRRRRAEILPEIEQHGRRHAFAFVVPLSALRDENLDGLLAEIRPRLPPGPFLYPIDQPTDRSERFLVAEIIREKLLFLLQQELPYALAVEVEAFEREQGITRIAATIWVARENHKAIVIGRGGALLKDVGQRARRELEASMGHKVFLRLWVKVRTDWADDSRSLRAFGYDES